MSGQADAALADQLQPVSQRRPKGQRLAEQRLDGVAAVDVRVVEAGDAQVGPAFDPPQPLGRRPPLLVQPPGAGDDRAQVQHGLRR